MLGVDCYLGDEISSYNIVLEVEAGCEHRKQWQSMVPTENLETQRGVRATEKGRRLQCAGGGEETENHPLLKCSETKRWKQETLKNKWSHINE